MKSYYLSIILVMILMKNNLIQNDLRNFHINVTNIETVNRFEKTFPQIVQDEYVYIAYLLKYYNKKPNEYIKLLKNRKMKYIKVASATPTGKIKWGKRIK